jgi:hypothetical protein
LPVGGIERTQVVRYLAEPCRELPAIPVVVRSTVVGPLVARPAIIHSIVIAGSIVAAALATGHSDRAGKAQPLDILSSLYVF